MDVSARQFIALLVTLVVLSTGCSTPKVLSEDELTELNKHNQLLSEAEHFVHANIFTGMVHVRATNLQEWNQLLIAYSCSADLDHTTLDNSYNQNYPIFVDAMKTLAEQEDLFTSTQAKNVLADVSQLAYRLFSVSYATGYARQIQLADTLSPGIREELCDGRVGTVNSYSLGYRNSVAWRSFDTALLANNNGLQAHAKNGDKAFQTLLNQQYEQFDALVYSHAYQQTDAYQSLFFEVNKFENVELYGKEVTRLSLTYIDIEAQNKHNDFAYLMLSSGYHWGMMSVLALLEEEYPRVHALKQHQGVELVKDAVGNLNRRQ
ncbi:hypothetical protein Q4574_10960 [Aliiglaciecola sp. 3_MG-2023]|uniref:hypothetical protein n=1 Tax=Aliiglaciecola sp. 3_MG-2023 TaxID=3062644 RepID=UPI0026E41EC5|nr:hypothetical protein [Aliiglaciecola sp. 3_MG-2023]MDO6693809.1 hypothetical protein [Aliiglaciecola sp. 3_MG-2023]